MRIQATVIRKLLMGHFGALDPRGVRLRGVLVTGPLDLDRITAIAGLTLKRCAMSHGISCKRTYLPWISLRWSRLSYLKADGLRIDGDLDLRRSSIHGNNKSGTVRLLNANIGGLVSLTRAEIKNNCGYALFADGLRTGSTLFMKRTILWGAGERGAVRLLSVHIGGPADLSRAEIINDSGPALYADRLRTDSTLFLNHAILRGAGERDALRLSGARIGGQADMTKTQVLHHGGRLMVLNEMTVEDELVFPPSVVCPQRGVNFGRRACIDEVRKIGVRDLVFSRLADVAWQEWLHLLVHHTHDYRSQPFQQLAKVERAAGHDNFVREILIAQQMDLLRRTPEALGGKLGRWRHRLWGLLGRFGYRANRLVAALAMILVFAGGLAYVAGQIPTRPDHYAAERVVPPNPLGAPVLGPGTPCSTAELIGLGIDRGLPVGATGLRARCDLDTATRRGQAFTYALWAVQALVWALATLTVAAYTGLVRKPT